jgi:ribokinase
MIKAFVLGSLNIDLVLSLDHIVQPSETCNVNGIQEFLGGKGANQAVALALASSSNVYLIANVGRKDFNRLTDELKGFGVVPILTLDELTGQAIIQVEKSGENAILLIPNANMSWDLETIYQELLNHNISKGDYILLQNEVSLNVIQNE